MIFAFVHWEVSFKEDFAYLACIWHQDLGSCYGGVMRCASSCLISKLSDRYLVYWEDIYMYFLITGHLSPNLRPNVFTTRKHHQTGQFTNRMWLIHWHSEHQWVADDSRSQWPYLTLTAISDHNSTAWRKIYQ